MANNSISLKLTQDLLEDDNVISQQNLPNQIVQLKEKVQSEQFKKSDDQQQLQILIQLFQKLQNQLNADFQSLLYLYDKVFPELKTILFDSELIAKAILAFGDFVTIDQQKLNEFDKQTSMNLLMSSFNKNMNEISNDQKIRIFSLAKSIIGYSCDKRDYLSKIQKLVQKIAPNTQKIAGDLVTAQLLAQVGGIQNLANIPACNIQVIGEKQKALNGLSKVNQISHVGFFEDHYLFNKTDIQYRKKLVRFLSNGVAKASKIDVGGFSQDGALGQQMFNKMMEKFNNIQKPRKRERIQPMKTPGTEIKKRRGGKKYRNMKKALEETEVRKLKNRLEFGANYASDIFEEGKDLGMLKSVQQRKLKIQKKKQKVNLSKKQKVNLGQQNKLSNEKKLVQNQQPNQNNISENKKHKQFQIFNQYLQCKKIQKIKIKFQVKFILIKKNILQYTKKLKQIKFFYNRIVQRKINKKKIFCNKKSKNCQKKCLRTSTQVKNIKKNQSKLAQKKILIILSTNSLNRSKGKKLFIFQKKKCNFLK